MTQKQTKFSFEESFSTLEKLVQAFEDGKFDLDTSLTKFEEGLEMVGALKKKLLEMENKVTDIKKKFGSDLENTIVEE